MKGKVGIVLIGCAILVQTYIHSSQFANKKDSSMEPKTEKATFAGGCFWCMQPLFDKVNGVVSTTVGYTGGSKKNPTYDEVSEGGTGHTESIEIVYDPARVSYEQLLDIFWKNIDPLSSDRQFCDVGTQYRPAIFYHNEQQKKMAEIYREKLKKSEKFKETIVTQVVPASIFYPAEEYHQKYYQKNSVQYKVYRYSCGRDKRLKELWDKK